MKRAVNLSKFIDLEHNSTQYVTNVWSVFLDILLQMKRNNVSWNC